MDDGQYGMNKSEKTAGANNIGNADDEAQWSVVGIHCKALLSFLRPQKT
jgi:hypothetical protein